MRRQTYKPGMRMANAYGTQGDCETPWDVYATNLL